MVTNRPLLREELFQVSIDKINPEWTSSLMLGVLAQPPDKLHLPVSMCWSSGEASKNISYECDINFKLTYLFINEIWWVMTHELMTAEIKDKALKL